MEQEDGGAGLTKSAAVGACTAMAVFYVAILYSPTLILRLPPPNSFKSFMIRRFVCAAVSSLVSLIVCSLILPIRRRDASNLLWVYGIRVDHIWQALVFPLSLTSFMYTGSFAWKLLSMLQASNEHLNSGGNELVSSFRKFVDWVLSLTSSVSSWRNYFVAPLTEELVFRACMIPLLLCGGFSTYTVIFLCPIFFSLGVQLGYTVIFGAYASFLLVRTGHLTAPLIAHIFCNFMGLPVIVSRRSGQEVRRRGLSCQDKRSEICLISNSCICDGDAGFLLDAFPIHKSTFVQQ
ncbi:UNVERIFIED_CONTAM: CAAX prenyl protease 2 [Sesamum angustifolium]|uniref:intramembrane prenyl-peptidase Rce1 n=1 Tax=Sesamum angustifolium TaxID=2727405 RepID=A0AAW2N5A5_9LAMI